MGVTIETKKSDSKQSHTTAELLQAFKIDSEVIKKFTEAGYSLLLTPTAVKVQQNMMPVASIPMKSQAVKYALEGALADSSLQSVAHKIMSVIGPLISHDAVPSGAAKLAKEAKKEKYAKMYGANKLDPIEVGDLSEDISKPKTIKEAVAAKKKKVAVDPGVETKPDKILKKGQVDSLSLATELYQHVKGTSNGSEYIVLALSDELKVAARYKGTTLSVRAEGDMTKHQKRIKEAGFDPKTDSYCSVHLSVDNSILARRAAASVLGGLDVQFDTPWPDLKKMGEGK